jgi:hypothetical protein
VPIIPRWHWYGFQNDRFAPAVLRTRDESFAEAITESGPEVRVETDAQFDTDRDGKWCCMELINNETGKVLGCQIMSKREAGKSTLAEAAATRKGLTKLKGQLEAQWKRVVEVVHDCHKAVSTVIREVVPGAKDSMDMWHVTKGVLKDGIESLTTDYQELQKLDEELRGLHAGRAGAGKRGLFSMVKNHWYWSAEQSRIEGKDDVNTFHVRFVEGLLRHLCDDHSLCEDPHTGIRHCKLRKDGVAFKALEAVLRSFAMDARLAYYTRCRVSENIEGLHRLNIKYAAKTLYFSTSYEWQVASAQLDWNAHRHLYRARSEVDNSRKRAAGDAAASSITPPRKKVRVEEKSYNFRAAIMKRIVDPNNCSHNFAKRIPPNMR